MLNRLFLIVPVLVIAFTAMPALAQADVSPAPDTQRWIPIMLAVVLVLVVGTISFWGSRRGHQD